MLASAVLPAEAQDTKENSEFKLAVNLYNDRMYELALDQFNNFIRAYPGTANSLEAQIYLGLTQMKLKQYGDARVTFQNFALANPTSAKAPEAWMRVGDAYVAEKNDREAASAYERVKVFHPNSPLAPEALLKAAIHYRKAGIKESARKALRTIVQDHGSSASVPLARLNMGELYLDEGRTSLAEAEFVRVADQSTDVETKARAMMLRGRLYRQVGRETDAERMFTTVVNTFPTSTAFSIAAYELGLIYQRAGKQVQAAEQFKKAIDDRSADPETKSSALAQAGSSYAALDDFANARRYFDLFLSTYPDHSLAPSVQYQAGTAALKAGKTDAAFDYFGKVIAGGGEELYKQKAIVASGETALRARDYPRAVEFFSRYVELYPLSYSTPEVLYRLGYIFENDLKDFRRSIIYYEDLLRRYPAASLTAEAAMAIGRCYELMNNDAGALSAYKELLARYPASDSAQRADDRVRFLTDYRLRDQTQGFEQLVRLIGETIAGKPKPQLLFALGQIHFEALRDYKGAAENLTAAIDAGLPEKQFADAYFLRARAYHLLSEIDPSYTNEAITYYGAFLKQFPGGAKSDEAAFYQLLIRVGGKSDEERGTLASEYLTARPASAYLDRVLLLLAQSREKRGQNREALTTLLQIPRSLSSSPLTSRAWLSIGNLYNALGLTDSAALAWNAVVQLEPKGRFTPESLSRLADIRMKQGKPADAALLYRRLIDDFSYTFWADKAGLALGDAYFAAGDFDRAIAQYQNLSDRSTQSPFDVEAPAIYLFKLARTYQAQVNFQKASEFYQRFLVRDVKSSFAADACIALGSIQRDQGNPEPASAYFKRAAEITGSGRPTREISDLLFQSGQFEEAGRMYAALAAAAASDDEKQYALARTILSRLRANDLKAAQPLIIDFTKSYKKSELYLAEIEYEKGLCQYRAEDYAGARVSLSNVTGDFGKTRFAAWADFYLAKILEVTNKQVEATKRYHELLKRYPESDVLPRIYLSLGNTSYNAEKYQEAATYYQKIIDSPTSAADILPFAMNNLIGAYESVEIYDAALKLTRDFIDRYPNDAGNYDKRINIGVYLTRLSYYEQAALHLQKLLDEAPSDLEAEIRYNIGEAHYYKGDYAQAILEFLKVPYLVSKKGKLDWTATSLYMAGQAYEKMSKFDQAISMYQQIVDRPGIDPTFKAGARKEVDRVKTVMKKGTRQ